MVKSPYRATSDSYGDCCGMLVCSCIKHEAITSLWALLEKPFENLHFLQNISQKIQSLWEYLWGTILMARSGTFVYMRYASAVGLLPCECEMSSSRTAFSIVTSRRSARNTYIIAFPRITIAFPRNNIAFSRNFITFSRNTYCVPWQYFCVLSKYYCFLTKCYCVLKKYLFDFIPLK